MNARNNTRQPKPVRSAGQNAKQQPVKPVVSNPLLDLIAKQAPVVEDAQRGETTNTVVADESPFIEESTGADETNAEDTEGTEGSETAAEDVVVPEQVGINSGLAKSVVEEAAALLTQAAPEHRERAVSEREQKLQKAIAERAARTVNPVTEAVQKVIQPKNASGPTVTPAVQTAYDMIDKVMDVYFDIMEPGKALSEDVAALQQLSMYRLVKSILTTGGPTMRHSMAYLMMIMKEHRTTTFSATYALRGLRSMRGTEFEQEFWRLLMEALVAFCEPEGVALRIKRIDIPRLKVSAQRVEGTHNTTLAGNLAIFITQHTRAG